LFRDCIRFDPGQRHMSLGLLEPPRRMAITGDVLPAGEAFGVPGVERREDGRLVIPRTPEALWGFATLIRGAELMLLDLFSKGQLSGTTHTCIGQEFCQMAVVRALDHPADAVLSNHRNHGHFLTFSGEFRGLLAEVMGRAAGVCGGRGGSQHIAWRHFHSNGVQGGMTAIGAGLAKARMDAGSDGIVAVMIGDGTLGEGLVYETMNLAAVWSVPLLFVVEHNGIAQTTATASTLAGNIVDRGHAFGLATWSVADGDDRIWEVAETAVRFVREQRRPGFLVIETNRLGPHSKGDDARPAAELEHIRVRDPLTRLGQALSPDRRASIGEAAAAFLANALAEAMASPEASYAEPPRSLFTSVPPPIGDVPPMSGLTVRAALNATLDRLLTEDSRTVLLGEDLHDPHGGAFKVTSGLSTRHPGRVLSTPISEAALAGAAIGLALAGRRPIVEVMFADFLTLCADQLYNHAIKFPGIFPELSVPLVIRAPAGGRRGYGPTHSQSPEHLFTAMPGLTVVYGSHRHDVGALLWNAVRHWPYPTVFMEHKLLYGVVQGHADYLPLPPHHADPGGASFPTMLRRGAVADAVILTYGGMLLVVEEAVGILEREEEIAVDVLALAQLAPLPRHALIAALSHYDRVVIAEEAPGPGGVGAEIAALLAEAGYRGRVRRVATPPVPIPAARSLEAALLPNADTVVQAVLSTI
jgi:2-oxoisovalerate dehydrogenase E1 component